MLIFIVLLTFTCLALAVMSLYFVFARTQSAVTARLEDIDPTLSLVENSPLTTMAEKVAEPLNRIVPISAVEAAKLQKQLLLAGYPHPDAAMTFRAIQLVLMIAFPTLTLSASFYLQFQLTSVAIWSLVGVAFGFYLPKFIRYIYILHHLNGK